MDKNILLKGGTVLCGSELEPQEADVLIEDGVIKAIGVGLPAGEARQIDAGGKLVMPGLVNAHLHSDENLVKGKTDSLPLELWMLYSYPPLAYGPFSPRLVYLRTLLGAIEMVKSGVTLVQDDVSEYPRPSLEGMDAVMTAYRDIGLRASVTANLSDKTWPGKVPFIAGMLPADLRDMFQPAGNKDELYEYCLAVIEKWHRPEGRLHFVVAPSAPQRCTDEFLIMLDKLSRDRGLPVHTHILETKMQVVTGRELYGTSIIRHLHELGVLSNRMTVIHSVWVSDDDIRLMGEAGVSVAHNPVSNLKLGSGIMPLRKLVDAGVNVAIGSDGMSSNDTQNIFEGMKFTALLHKVANPDYRTWPTSREVLKMATQGGARSTLWQHETGTLEVGKKADIAILDLKTAAFTPQNDLINHLVYCENGGSVETVIVDGQVVVENHRLLTVDEDEILEELRSYLPEYESNYSKIIAWSKKLFPYVDEVYWKCARKNVGLNRWTGDEREWVKD